MQTLKKPVCKRCGNKDVEYLKNWELRGSKSGKDFMIYLWRCKKCGYKFRTSEPLD